MITRKALLSQSLIAVALIFSTAASATQSYKLYGEARAGSRFRTVEVNSPIPLNKGYDKLSAAQQDWFRETYYTDLPKTEIPPYPVKGSAMIYKPLIKHRSKQLDQAREGTLFLVAMVNKTGKVENVSVYSSPSPIMSELATNVVFNTPFTPASCHGEPCDMEFPFEFKMQSLKKR